MGYTPKIADVHAFLQDQAHLHGVLGYLDDSGNPDSAFVAFSVTGHLDIIFGTSDESRKYRLLLANRHVSFNVTDRESRYTVQVKGRVRELAKPELLIYEAAHYAKLGDASRRFRDMPDQHFFLIRPHWLRFSDCLEEPWTLTTLIP